MKKFLMVLALASVSVAGMAQETTEKYSVATNSFWSNWFIQANVAGTAFYSSQENNLNLSNSPLKGFRNNLGASVAIGKWFTPGLGLRTKVNGVWGRTVNGDDKKANASKYWQANEQVLFNLSNMLCGYNPDRVWNFIPYLGGGIGRNMTYNSYAMGLQAGLLNEFRLSRKFALNLDLSFGMHEPDFDGNAIANASTRSPKSKDRDLNLEIGLTYNLGKATWNKVPDVDAINALHQSQLDALNAQLADANAENDRLNNLIKNHKCPEAKTVTVKEVATAPVSVFFNIGKSKIASRKDLQNVKAMTETNKDAKFVVTGYADSKTGSASYNQKLSQKRAEAVANELVKMGVSRDNIEIVAKGGVADLTPISYNRRATVEIK
ncbi:OmpA family protein [Prevotella communis]|uniref:OmpA family protein n=1 Tax=Prevotella communis TaxID=2913614 RepID=UPI001EDA1B7D|nr:OmpA family protein [Prevotella communis]UKK57300.1 OmpA family protein [Prevotella communis]UKK67966.1 OmpA family protein [Prevotella communis]UKK69899.1 OmpA family protein [Prevotella communis]